jgi:hypothetical protein
VPEEVPAHERCHALGVQRACGMRASAAVALTRSTATRNDGWWTSAKPSASSRDIERTVAHGHGSDSVSLGASFGVSAWTTGPQSTGPAPTMAASVGLPAFPARGRDFRVLVESTTVA